MPHAPSPTRATLVVSLAFLAAAACSSTGPKAVTGGGGAGGTTGAAGTNGSGGATAGGAGATSTAGTTGATGSAGASGGGDANGGSGGATGGSSSSGAGTDGNADAANDKAAADAGGEAKDGGALGDAALARFSFFETSLVAMQRLSKSQNGFGGDLRYGQPDGLAGADKICTEVAETSMPGAGAKGWHAFLSAASGPGGQPVNAIDRIGDGPWYDRLGRVFALTKAALLNVRPQGADPAILNDLPNENGVPNHRPDPNVPEVDNHHVLTGSDAAGRLYSATATCMSWTSTAKSSAADRPRIGFSWILSNRTNWISGQDEGGCGAGVNVAETGGSDPNNPIVGSGGGYGAIYCFANAP
jgi:hypothetical protein